METIYEEIGRRTGGNIYVGVVGPVRTGKSTLIKRIMEEMVIPAIEDPYQKERARDELPQSGSGKMIMTSEPKFVPEEAVEICPDGAVHLKVRFIDSVGYMVEGAVGAEEDGKVRMVTTPWFPQEIPMTQAAELGTKKVMDGHCSLGILVTTDGTVTEIPRNDYIEAEKRAILDMKATGKPFLVVINSRDPEGEPAKNLQKELEDMYSVPCMAADCQSMDETDFKDLFGALLYTFPMTELQVRLPRWMDALEQDHPVKQTLYDCLLTQAQKIGNLSQAAEALSELQNLDAVESYHVDKMDLGSGIVSCSVVFPQSMFYEILSSKAGVEVRNDGELLSLLTDLSSVKKEYDKIADALSSAKATGYGVVMPTAEEMKLETPQILRKGGAYGVRLKAGAPSSHMVRVDIDTEISPMVGDEKQSRELISYLTGEDPEKLWQSNIFGKSVYDLIQEGLTAKLLGMPQEVRAKFRGTLGRIVNEGATGLICIIL